MSSMRTRTKLLYVSTTPVKPGPAPKAVDGIPIPEEAFSEEIEALNRAAERLTLERRARSTVVDRSPNAKQSGRNGKLVGKQGTNAKTTRRESAVSKRSNPNAPEKPASSNPRLEAPRQPLRVTIAAAINASANLRTVSLTRGGDIRVKEQEPQPSESVTPDSQVQQQVGNVGFLGIPRRHLKRAAKRKKE